MDTPTQSPKERLDDALAAFQHEQSLLPSGVQGFNLPDIAQPAAVNALIVLLTEKGLITNVEYEDAVLTQRAALVEDLVRQARAFKRDAGSRLVMPGATTR